ncbi:INO80 complex subunit E [Petromyzon marinus]|uniref:INO80 complex subunit E n=1 Tax=Petromyzon marinus TaxID=7757 RepID=UPI003F6F47C8
MLIRGNMNGQPDVDYRKKYRSLKRKLRLLVYEQETFQDELRKAQRKLLKVSRDKSFLLDRLLQYETLEDSSTDSDATASSENSEGETQRAGDAPPSKKKKSHTSPFPSAVGPVPSLPRLSPVGFPQPQQPTPPHYIHTSSSQPPPVGRSPSPAPPPASASVWGGRGAPRPHKGKRERPPKPHKTKKTPKLSLSPSDSLSSLSVSSKLPPMSVSATVPQQMFSDTGGEEEEEEEEEVEGGEEEEEGEEGGEAR